MTIADSQPGAQTDKLATLIAIAFGAALMASTLLLAPIIAGQFIVKYGFTEVQAGWAISAELAGISLASLPALYWLGRVPWRRVLLVSLIATAIGNLVSTQFATFEALALTRFITALFAGNVMIITMQAAAQTNNPERSYSAWLIGQLVLGAIGLAILPFFFARFGLSGYYLVFAAFSLCLIFVIPHLPDGATDETEKTRQSKLPVIGLIGLAGLACYYLSIGGVWTFIEQVGVGTLTDPGEDSLRQTIGLVLSIATIAGIIGAMSASWVERWATRRRWVLFGCALLIASIITIAIVPGLTAYSAAAIAFKFAWTFTIPFILAGLAIMDRSGTLITLSNVIIGMALALGPFVAGFFLKTEGDYKPMLFAMAAFAIASSALLFVSMKPKEE